MVVQMNCGMVSGITGEIVHVETDVSNGLPVFNMIGYLSSEVKEARERVRTAIKNSGFRLLSKRISVNLSPADLRKSGTYFDLAIAIGILAAYGEIRIQNSEETILIGELSLNGDLKPVNGILPIVMCAKINGMKRCIIPMENVSEARLIEGIDMIGADCLKEVVDFLNDGILPDHPLTNQLSTNMNHSMYVTDLSSVKGQKLAKRALEIAVAGYHNLYLDGPPGAGKSMIASCIPGIMPDMDMDDMLEAAMIYSVKGLLHTDQILCGKRPYRAPSKNISITGMYGGGIRPMPGEVSLANHGVLYLDEFPEFDRNVIEMLRVPLESHNISIVRNGYACDYPADFLLVTAANPCPCGFYPDRGKCTCTETQIKRYKNRISGPIMDRIDLFVRCEKVDYKTLTDPEKSESSEIVRTRIENAWCIQKERYKNESFKYNGRMGNEQIRRYCVLDHRCRKTMEQAYESFGLTGRSYYKVIKCARTIADLAGEDEIGIQHLHEALTYRRMRQNMWGEM